jgi:short chain dehydrogenase
MRIIVTGGKSGIGKATAAALTEGGHSVVIACRSDKTKDRVISVASAMYHCAHIHFDDLNSHTRRYSGMTDTGIPRSAASRLHVGERNPLWHILQTPAQGARASLQAMTTELPSGTYLAPRFNQWGKPRVTGLRKKARDPVAARRLWELSAELTGCDWL